MERKIWIKASDVRKLTGWDKNKMHKARQLGWVKVKRDGGIFYDLKSIPQEFLKTA
jgi:hypothetical protein